MDSVREFDIRIRNFLNKYYKNLIIKGSILSVIFCSLLFFLLASLEFIFWFNSSIRLLLLVVLVVSILFTFYYYILIPLLSYFRVFKRITNKHTANLLSIHFPELRDYIHNIFELKSLSDSNNELVIAALNQKISYTTLFDFNSVINFKNSIKLVRFLFVVALIYLVIYSFKPGLIIDSSKRIVNFNNVYIKQVGYSFIVDTSKLYVERGNNLDINIKLEGDEIPQLVSIFIGNNEYLCTKLATSEYTFTIKNVNNDLTFRLGSSNYKSDSYNVYVISSPYLKSIEIEAKYPSYTNLENQLFKNIYNLKIPTGTILTFKLNTNYTQYVEYNADSKLAFETNNNWCLFTDTVYHSYNYYISGHNSNSTKTFIDKGIVNILPDLYPEIKVVELVDNNDKTIRYFKGIIEDDYGFTNLVFEINNEEINVPFNKNINSQEFFFSYKFEVNKDVDEYSYFFKVVDNDVINGFKESLSENFNYKLPNYKQLSDFKEKEDLKVKEKFEKSLLMANEIKRDIENIKSKIFSENLSAFDKKELLNQITDKQNRLNDILNDLVKSNNEKNAQLNSFANESDEIRKKQEKIQDLLESIMDEELKNMLDELQKLSEDFNKEKLNEELNKLEFNYDKLSEQLDRNMELLSKYEIERNIENVKNELFKLAERNDEYADSLSNFSNIDSLLNKENEIVEELRKDYNENFEKNDDLENPLNLSDFDKEFEDLKESIKKSNSNGELKDNFKKNKEKANDLANKINSMLNNNRVDENGENAETLRQILENLIYFSFTQESLVGTFTSISQNSPSFIDNTLLQQDLQSVYTIIKDSLLALSKRTPQVGKHINDKVYDIESNLISINSNLLERHVGRARLEQRKVLEYSNDLILLLSESLKNMENSSGTGNGKASKKKNKPKQGEPSLSEMRKSQESIKSQLQSMINQMKGGQGKPGAEQLAKMLAQQEMFQSMMNQLMQQGKVGSDILKELNEINKMIEENKRDLINNNVSKSTLYRQNNIVTRLLKSEKAEKERELDDKRESKEALNKLVSDPSKMFEESKKSTNFNDILFKNNVRLKYYYQNKYQEYIKNLE